MKEISRTPKWRRSAPPINSLCLICPRASDFSYKLSSSESLKNLAIAIRA